MSSHRVAARLVSLFGGAAVAATVAFAMPGLQIARAADDAAGAAGARSIDPQLVQRVAAPRIPLPDAEQNPSCRNPDPVSLLDDALVEYQTQQLLREIAKAVAAPQAAPRSSERGIVLNGRGYNYTRTRSGSGP